MITIQHAAKRLAELGHTFKPLQPIIVDGKFVAQYEVDGKVVDADQVKKLMKGG